MNATFSVESQPLKNREQREIHSTRLNAKALPFTVKIVRNEEQLHRAVGIRAEAYSRHWPNLSSILQEPEAQDRDPNSLIFLAESKDNGDAVGTMRIDTNLHGDLLICSDPNVPEFLKNEPLAYVTRLGVKQGSTGPLAKLLMFKALCRYCIAKQISWILVGVRPPGDRDYQRLGFIDIIDGGKPVPIVSSAGTPVRLMAFEIMTSERSWKESGNPLYSFMFQDYHPDIEIFQSVSGMWSRPRKDTASFAFDTSVFDANGLPIV